MRTPLAVVFLVILITAIFSAPLSAGRYIVTLNSSTDLSDYLDNLEASLRSSTARDPDHPRVLNIIYKYTIINGFAAEIDPLTVNEMMNDPLVQSVEQDQVVSVSDQLQDKQTSQTS